MTEPRSLVTNVLTIRPGERANALPTVAEQLERQREMMHQDAPPCDVEPFQAPDFDPA